MMMQSERAHRAGNEAPADVWLIVPLIVAIFVIAVAIAYVAPIADPGLRQTSDYTPQYSAEAVGGRSIYATEGCWYCHTQSVRPVANDLGLGGVTSPERVARDRPPLIGMSRTGPDLACAGDRMTDAAALAKFLKDPRSVREGAKMPSFGYLSDDELADLAAYLSGLRCLGG